MRIAMAVLVLSIGIVSGYGQQPEEPAGIPTEKSAPAVNDPETEPAQAEVLTEKEQADLAKRSEEPGREVAGGALSNLHLTYIVIALGAIVLVLLVK